MDDLISKASVCEILADIYPTDGEKVVAVKEIDKAYETILNLPYAERHGRWIDIEHAPNGLLYATCSVCGKRQTIEATNYCGNCGSDMREAKNGCDDCFIPMFYNLEDDDSICKDCEVGE